MGNICYIAKDKKRENNITKQLENKLSEDNEKDDLSENLNENKNMVYIILKNLYRFIKI